jgi:hypothetical protein
MSFRIAESITERAPPLAEADFPLELFFYAPDLPRGSFLPGLTLAAGFISFEGLFIARPVW